MAVSPLKIKFVDRAAMRKTCKNGRSIEIVFRTHSFRLVPRIARFLSAANCVINDEFWKVGS